MRFKILYLFLLIVLSSSILASDDYFRDLGEGCFNDNFFGSCTSNCEWKVLGSSVVKRCQDAHGWCDADNGCDTCDYVRSNAKYSLNYICDTINCNDINNLEPLRNYDETERKYIVSLCEQKAGINIPISFTGVNLICEDSDKDGFGTDCREGTCDNSNCVNAINLKSIDNDCDDNDDFINPNTIWIIDEDGDGRWGDVYVGCEPKNSDWIKQSSFPLDEDFDCDDSDDENAPFPQNCYCGEEDLGKTNNGAYCMDKTSTHTESLNIETEFTKYINDLGFVWQKQELKEDIFQTSYECPIDTCPIMKNDVISCANVGTFWKRDGNYGGNNYCALDESSKGYWTTRSSDINSIFMAIGELSKKDFSIYCDDLEDIIPTTHQNQGNFFEEMLNLKEDATSNLGEGCVLLINTPLGNDLDYSQRILNGEVPLPESQKIIFGMTLDSINDRIFGIDFTNREIINDEWIFGKQGNKNSGLIYNDKKKLLMIVQSDELGMDEELSEYIYNMINPNNIKLNFYNFLLDPIQQIINYFNSDDFDQEKYDEIFYSNFEQSYLSMNQGTFFYSVLENNQLIIKVVNPNDQTKDFVDKICNDEIFESDFRCSISNDVIGMTSDISFLEDFEKRDIWRRFSRQLRLQGNMGGSANFRDGQCTTDNYLSTCQDKTCYNKDGCLEIGLCKYSPITSCVNNDGCCPNSCVFETDNDCQRVDPLKIPISVELRYDFNCDEESNEVNLLSMSYDYNAHVENPNLDRSQNWDEHFNNLLCISTEEGSFDVNLRDECNNDEENLLYFHKEKDSHVSIVDVGFKSLCIKHSIYNMSCMVADKQSCEGFNTLLSLTTSGNSHVGGPDYYDSKLCCRFYE
ncbi:hypothetical protein KY321_03635 [Candidatus Woesearchaeota archaeon]|nr:hypothetical protein [Candidatus Woesearchaeota archaeon]